MSNTSDPMITHHIGRFIIQTPRSMKVVHSSASLRHRELRGMAWPTGAVPEVVRNETWASRIAEIEKLPPPEGKAKALIEERDMTEPSGYTRAVLYFGDPDDGDRVFGELLTARKQSGVWIKSVGVDTKVQKMMEQNGDIARAYHSLDSTVVPPKGNVFYLEHGYIALPYRSQEGTYSRFEGHPLNVTLEITTTETHQVEPSGPLDRLAAVLATNFAPGVKLDRIRGGKRVAAGLKGEEIVLKMTNDDKSAALRFGWEYHGKVDSGNEPEIRIEMEAEDGQLDEKLKLWDAVLNSFKPAGR